MLVEVTSKEQGFYAVSIMQKKALSFALIVERSSDLSFSEVMALLKL